MRKGLLNFGTDYGAGLTEVIHLDTKQAFAVPAKGAAEAIAKAHNIRTGDKIKGTAVYKIPIRQVGRNFIINGKKGHILQGGTINTDTYAIARTSYRPQILMKGKARSTKYCAAV